MDLWAYANIGNVEEIANANGIDCPRLRGYRLMKDEEPIDYREIVAANSLDVECVKNLIRCEPRWDPNAWGYVYDDYTDYLIKKYVDDEHDQVRWGRIHGWKRRVLKTYIHNETVRYRKQYEVWNKYAGREDVLYIHARIGGNNWPCYYKQVVDKWWFIEKVDDAFDSTYCDIYARIRTDV